MRIMKYWGTAALGVALSAIGAACWADDMIPSDHWDFSTFTEGDSQYSIAAIMATSKDSIINVICDPGGVYVSIDPMKSLPKVVEDRGLSLAFDGGTPIVQHWKSGTLTGGG